MDAAISLGAQRNDAVGLIRCGVIDQQAILIDWERLMARQSSQCVLVSLCVCGCVRSDALIICKTDHAAVRFNEQHWVVVNEWHMEVLFGSLNFLFKFYSYINTNYLVCILSTRF